VFLSSVVFAGLIVDYKELTISLAINRNRRL